MSHADVAKKFKKTEQMVQAWENGDVFPTFSQLEKLAYEVYKRPLAVFFLPEPPKETTAKQDFRTLPDKDVSSLSPTLRLFIRRTKHHQVVLKELYTGVNPAERKIYKDLSFQLKFDARKSAIYVRDYFGLDQVKKKAFAQNSDAFNSYRGLIEEAGIFIFQYPLKEVRGFSLMDKEFPVIVVNSSDAPTAKVFTLFHELCHILFNTGGVFRDFITEELRLGAADIEQFCNEFASEFLVPSEELTSFLRDKYKQGPDWDDDAVRSIAASFNVSKEVILRRLLDLKLVDKSHYSKLVKRWNDQYFKLKEQRKTKKGGPSYQTLVISHLGKKFIYEVLENYHSGKLDMVRASNFLGVRANQLSKLEDKLY